jgi:thermitase
MNVKVCDDVGRCEASTAAEGIIWAVNHGARVINISFCVESSPDLEEAINYAWSQGCVIVAAAGNEGKSTPAYPACYANCFAVAATNANDSLALLSNHGDWVDVAAPGFKIYSTFPQNEYGYRSGTSSSAAYVSGVAALVFSVAKDTNGNGVINDEVREAIESSCSPVSAAEVGEGCISAFKAVTKAISSN